MTEVYVGNICPRCKSKPEPKLVMVRRKDIPGTVKVYKYNNVTCKSCLALNREDRREIWLATHGCIRKDRS